MIDSLAVHEMSHFQIFEPCLYAKLLQRFSAINCPFKQTEARVNVSFGQLGKPHSIVSEVHLVYCCCSGFVQFQKMIKLCRSYTEQKIKNIRARLAKNGSYARDGYCSCQKLYCRRGDSMLKYDARESDNYMAGT